MAPSTDARSSERSASRRRARPPFWVDASHGAPPPVGTTLDTAFEAAQRSPATRLPQAVTGSRRATPGEEVAAGVTFGGGDDQNRAFVELTVEPSGIRGSHTAVDESAAAADTFTLA